MRDFSVFVVCSLLPTVNVVAQDPGFRKIPRDVPGKEYVVRIAYAIPTNREIRPAVIRNMQTLLPWLQSWYMDQMERHGYGRKTFQFETEVGSPPPVHLVRLPGSDTDYHAMGVDGGDTKEHSAAWLKLCKSAQKAGVPLSAKGQIWLIAYELHLQQPDGSIVGRINRGGPWSRNKHNGVGTAVTTLLGIADETGMQMTQPYDGMKLPEVGPYSMRYKKTFESYAGGNTMGGVISGEVSSMMHELSHTFGLKHNNLNDTTTAGNLMGVGYRGIRSEIYDRRFPGEAVNLSPASAALLNIVRQFNFEKTFDDDEPPTVNVSVSARPSGGHLVARVDATDNKDLGHAYFLIDGVVAASAPMSGTKNSISLRTYKYRAGRPLNWSVRVYDAQGQWEFQSGTVTPSKSPHAPVPVIQASSYKVKVNQQVMLDATNSKDPDSKQLTVAWDTDGDGKIDTRPNQQPKYPIRFKKPGHYKIRAQVSDGKNKSMTPPIVVTVE